MAANPSEVPDEMMENMDFAPLDMRLMFPSACIGSIIGKGGEVIHSIRAASEARINIFDPTPNMDARIVLIQGFPENVAKAIELIFASLEQGKQTSLLTNFVVRIPISNDQAGPVIGNGGETINSLREQSGARIEVSKRNNGQQQAPWMGLHNKIRIITVTGELACVKTALVLLSSILALHPSANASIFAVLDHSGPLRSVLGHIGNEHVMHMPPPGYMYAPQPGEYPGKGGLGGQGSSMDQVLSVQYPVPESSVGSVIGKGGRVINEIRRNTGCKIEIANASEDSASRMITITGTSSGVENAKYMIRNRIGDTMQ
jgi:polyribonucleotide nucleotidyltransferase